MKEIFNKKKISGRGRSFLTRGFSLIEMLVYISVLTIILTSVFSFLIWVAHSSKKVSTMKEALDNARRAMEIMTYEIKGASNVYAPTSVFGSSPGQLSLKTARYLPADETSSYIDFYICGTRLCLKKESQNPIALTSDSVEINNLTFTQSVTGSGVAVRIDLGVRYKNPHNRPEYDSAVNLQSAASIRY